MDLGGKKKVKSKKEEVKRTVGNGRDRSCPEMFGMVETIPQKKKEIEL